MQYFIDSRLDYKNYQNKSVLIIGGGPSTIEVNWHDLSVDYKWSCTNFFLNDDITKHNLDLVTLGNLQDYRNESLLNYLDKYKDCKILFEKNYLYPSTLTDNREFVERYQDRIHFGELDKKYTTIVGPPARLITLAANLGFSDIYFVGIDGFDKQLKNDHAFTSEKGLREGAVHSTYDVYYDAHTTFANRIFTDFGSRVRFYNLGEAVKYGHNIISNVSKDLFPLTKKVYEQIR